jgi:hypothetical protein
MNSSLVDTGLPLGDRLAKMAAQAREKAQQLPPGREKDELLTRARRAETAAHLLGLVGAADPEPRR